ncbi:MAG: phosphoribosyltransferase family protein [Gemmatimonadota bacterium]
MSEDDDLERRRFQLAGPERVESVLDWIARQIAAVDEDDRKIVGVRRRGVPLAERLAERLRHDGSVQELALKRYADDLTLLHDRPALEEDPELDLDGRSVLLVDDVLYTGRTLFRAAQIATTEGARRVRTAVLCSRGPNEVPVTADVTGLRLDVGKEHAVEVHTPPYEDKLGVYIVQRPE